MNSSGDPVVGSVAAATSEDPSPNWASPNANDDRDNPADKSTRIHVEISRRSEVKAHLSRFLDSVANIASDKRNPMFSPSSLTTIEYNQYKPISATMLITKFRLKLLKI